jgi:putative membrane protein
VRRIDDAPVTAGPRRRGSGRVPLQEVGDNPDYRFTLANERTFLAWVRTSLALMAAGVAVVEFVPGPAIVRHGLGLVLVLLGSVLAGVSYHHWERNERAMRLGERLPHSLVPRLTAGALGLVGLGVLALMVSRVGG